MKRIAGSATAVLAATALLACGGQSKEEKAKNSVCDARADISKQVDTLTSMTASTFSTTTVTDSIKAITDDLGTIKNAQGDLSGDRKQQVEAANQAFTTQVKSIASSVLTTKSLDSASTQLTAALQQLGTAYKQTFAPIDCGS